MSTDYLVTDTELTSVANAIRTKGGTASQLVFPNGFVSAINAIPTGGGGSGFEDISADFDFSASPTFFIALYNDADGKLVLSGLVEEVGDDFTISYIGGDEDVQVILQQASELFVCDGNGNGFTEVFPLDCSITFYAPNGLTYFGFYGEQP